MCVHYCTTALLHYSTTALLHYSIPPFLHYSTTPLLHYSTTALLHYMYVPVPQPVVSLRVLEQVSQRSDVPGSSDCDLAATRSHSRTRHS
jgi:hypothetical protein